MLLRQSVVDFDANPRIGCGIHLLLRCELLGCPVAQSLSLGYLLAENYTRNLTKALVFDAVLAHLVLQIDESFGCKAA